METIRRIIDIDIDERLSHSYSVHDLKGMEW